MQEQLFRPAQQKKRPCHRSHDPQFFLVRGVVRRTTEQPERADRLLAGLKAGKHQLIEPTVFGQGPRARVHSAEYLGFLAEAWDAWSALGDAGSEMIANMHPVRNPGSYPTHIVGRLGWHTVDTACPIGPGTWAAACAATERTRAVMAVHLYGIPADVGALSAMCAERSLSLIEDAAQAHGASWDRRPVGSWGIGAFSFYATKNMTTGEGGMVTTGDDEVAGRARSFANHGRRAGDPGGYAHRAFGLNLRMTDLAAAIGRVQLACLEEANAARRHLAALLTDVIPEAWRRPVPPAAEPVWHLFPLVVDDRDEVIERLQRQGVPTGIFYPAPVYRMAPHLPAGHCPVAESLGGRLVCLRIGAYDEPTRHRYAEAVASALGA